MNPAAGGAWRPDVERRLLRLVDEALECPADTRDALLVERLSDEIDLLPRARALLAACARAEDDEGLFASPAADYAAPVVLAVDASDPATSGQTGIAFQERLQALLGATYTLERELGGGGMARVFVATEMALGRRVVVKVLHPEATADISSERFRREIQLAAGLQHPHVVPLLTAGVAGDILYYTMPLVEGESLRARLARDGQLSLTETVRILRDVADALAYAHARGLVHRDIKPDNVLLAGNHALVTDFGVAKAMHAASVDSTLTATGIALGTPAFMAPEQAAGETDVDGRADLYALGCTAYEMLSGRPPFTGSLRQVIAQHIGNRPDPIVKHRVDVPPALSDLIARALEKNPADRPPSAQSFIDALDTVSTPNGRSIRAVRRLTLPRTAVLALMFIAALTLTAFGIWKHFRAPRLEARRIVVAPLENLTGDPSFDNVGRIAADWLTQGIAHMDSVSVVSSTAAAMAFDEGNGAYAERVRRLTRATHAELLVAGSVIRRRDSLQLDVQLTDARTGRVVSSLDPVFGPKADPMVAIDAARERLLGELAAEASWVRRLFVGTRPPTYAAYLEYLHGVDRFVHYRDQAGAIPHLERAIALDSTFTQPYLWLGGAYADLGRRAALDSLTRRAEGLLPRLTSVDRIGFEWLDALNRVDYQAALRTAQQLAARDSDGVWLVMVGGSALSLLRPRIAIPALQRADSALTTAKSIIPPLLLAAAFHEAGRYANELTTLERARRQLPDSRFILTKELSPLAGLRDSIRAVALADTVLRGETDTSGPSVAGVIDGAIEFRAHGNPQAADEIARLALAWYTAHPMAREPSDRAFQHGLAFFVSGRLDSAETYFARAAGDASFEAAGHLAVTRFARTHDRAAAARSADSLGALTRPWMFGANTFAQAGIAAQLGDFERATQLLRQATAHGQPMDSWHKALTLEPLRRYPPFVALIAPDR